MEYFCSHFTIKHYKTQSTWIAVGQWQVTFPYPSTMSIKSEWEFELVEQIAGEDALFPYCANWTEIVVPIGHLKVMYSPSQEAFWYVRNVPVNSAGNKRMIKSQLIQNGISARYKTPKLVFFPCLTRSPSTTWLPPLATNVQLDLTFPFRKNLKLLLFCFIQV